MKKLILTISSILTLTVNLFAQQNNVWVTIPNYEENKKEVDSLISNFGVTDIFKAVPSSKNPRLQELYQINCNSSETQLINEISKRKDLFVNPEVGPKYETLDLPNDYYINSSNQWALDLISSSLAWDITKGSSNVTIAITDANFYTNHEDLFGKYDYVSPNYNTNYSHGTAVAVIAGGNTNNMAGSSSIGYNTRLQLRAMDYNQLLEATYSGAKVINCSWASSCYFNSYAQQIIDEVYNNGSVVVASAGNGSTCSGASNLVFPASYNHVISVTSIGSMDNHERFPGNPSSTHQHNSMVDICAPGYDVPLTTAPGVYMTGNGTSFASPFVSGTVALMLSVNPCLTVDQIEYILKETADTNVLINNPNYQGMLGAGRLNSFKAVQMANNFNTMFGTFKSNVNCESGVKSISVPNLSGISPYVYEWMDGSSNQSISINENGLYSVRIIDSLGCVFSDSIYIEKYDKMIYESLITDVKCNGETNGEIQIEIFGGEYVSEITWNNGVLGNNLTNLSTGEYIFTVVDGFDCVLSDTLNVRQPDVLVSNITSVNPTVTSNGSINITIEGGTVPYTYEWNNGDTTQNLDNLSDGFYELLITDANGCMSSENVILTTQEEQNTSSIGELSYDEFLVYPNPSKGSVIIKKGKDNDCNLSITNINGQSVITQSTFNGEVSVNDLSEGVYLVTVDGKTQKLVVK